MKCSQGGHLLPESKLPQWVSQGARKFKAGKELLPQWHPRTGAMTSGWTSRSYHPPPLIIAIGESHRISPWCLLHGSHWKHCVFIMQDPAYEAPWEKFHPGLNTKDRHTSLEQLCYFVGVCAFLQAVFSHVFWVDPASGGSIRAAPGGAACLDPQILEGTPHGEPA